MKKLFITLAVFIMAMMANAHPGIGIVKDKKGNIFYTDLKQVWKISPDGKRSVVVPNVHTHEFTNWYNLYKADTAGNITMLANNIDRTTLAQAYTPGSHNLYGIWTDASENVYVAVPGGQLIRKISPTGEVSIAYHSLAPWSPAGGVFDNDGNMWVLENSATNEVRVTKIGEKDLAGGVKAVTLTWYNNIFPAVVMLPVLGSFVFLVYSIFRSRYKKIRAVETALKPLINNL